MAAKIMLSLPEGFLLDIDELARKEHRTRSELIREATRQYVERTRAYHRPIDDPQIKAAFESLDELKSKWKRGFESSTEIRRMRETRYR